MAQGFTTTPDPVIASAMDQGFVDGQSQLRSTAIRSDAGNAIVLELARQAAAQNADLNSKSASQTQTLITTKAADALLNGGLANDILAQRSAGGQPQASGNNAGVNSGGPATKTA